MESDPVVAVLPFKANGSDDGGFLASVLHNNLLTRLAKLGALMAHYSRLRGDVAATREWIDEHRRRFRASDKADISQDRNNRFHYAIALPFVGAYDEAVEELRVMLEEPAGPRFPYVDGADPFDSREDHHGYKEPRSRFGGQ